VPAPPYGSRGAGEDGNLGRRGGGSGSLTFTSLTASNQWLVPPAAGFGFGGAAGRPGFPVPGNPWPDGFCAVGGTAFAASFSFLAFCTHSGQVTSFALADWNHLPQVVQRILILLMRGLPCNIEILLARMLCQGDCVGMHLPVYHRVQLIHCACAQRFPGKGATWRYLRWACVCAICGIMEISVVCLFKEQEVARWLPSSPCFTPAAWHSCPGQ
jgi:hypothetical protein